MRYQGSLLKWNDDRGFGFITSPQYSGDIFVHISAFPDDDERPQVGEPISFEIETNSSGKKRATNVRWEDLKRIQKKKRQDVMGLATSCFAILGLSALIYTAYVTHLVPFKWASATGAGISLPRESTNQQFRCDGRQYCSQMTSRAEAEYFIAHCPGTKMDGDNDGIPCESDSRL